MRPASQLVRASALFVLTLHATGLCRAAGWNEQRVVGPFVCRADFSLTGYDGLFQELAGVQTELAKMLLIEPTREPVELYLFGAKSDYQGFLASRFPQAAERRALYVKGAGPGRIYVYRSKELPTDVRHESTHALLHGVLAMVPLWLDEGLAEYFEVPADDRKYDNPHMAAIRWNLRLGMVPHIAKLEAKRDLADMTASDYRYAWAWVHFMLHGPPEARDELVHFLGDIRANTPPGRLSERLERRLPQVERRLVLHFKSWRR